MLQIYFLSDTGKHIKIKTAYVNRREHITGSPAQWLLSMLPLRYHKDPGVNYPPPKKKKKQQQQQQQKNPTTTNKQKKKHTPHTQKNNNKTPERKKERKLRLWAFYAVSVILTSIRMYSTIETITSPDYPASHSILFH